VKIPLLSEKVGKPVLKSLFAGALLLGSQALTVQPAYSGGDCCPNSSCTSECLINFGIGYFCVGCTSSTYYCQSGLSQPICMT
jgi:hypothetical protein